MPKVARCPACDKRYLVPRKKLGTGRQCDRCGLTFVLGDEQLPSAGAEAASPSMERGPANRPAPPPKIGRFEIVSILGEGAFGVVYRARDLMLGRDVALKVPHPASLANSESQARFLREPKAAARLNHRHIVPIHDAGFDGRHYFIAYGFIEGQTLSESLKQGVINPDQGVEIVACLAEALRHAHQQGIVHRDVKPANILIDQQGQPHLTDFGLAFLDSDPERLTQEGAYLGTPAYMSPEQVGGPGGPVGPASDQYSLGVVMYEMLTCRVPFDGPLLPLVYQIRSKSPPAPRGLLPSIPADLETICLKSLSKLPGERYPDCQALADDLRKFSRHEPILARRPSLPDRAAKLLRRHPRGALATCAALALFAAIGIGLLLSRGQRNSRVVELERQGDALSATQPARAIETYREALGLARAWPRLSDREGELAEKVATLTAPAAARERLARFQRMAARFEAASPLPPGTPAHDSTNGELVSLAELALAQFSVLDQADWLTTSEARWLPAEERRQLSADVESLLESYFDFQEVARFRGAAFTGMGIHLAEFNSPDHALPRVGLVHADSPAQRADARAQDHLLAIDGVSVADLRDDEAVFNHVIGVAGSETTWRVYRPGETAPRELNITRNDQGRCGAVVQRFSSLRVVRVEHASEAETAGLLSGDLLLSIDDLPAGCEMYFTEAGAGTIPFVGWFRAGQAATPPSLTLRFVRPGETTIRAVKVSWTDDQRRVVQGVNLRRLVHGMRVMRGAFEVAISTRDPNRMGSLFIDDPTLPVADLLVNYYQREFGWPDDILRQAVAALDNDRPDFYEGLRLLAADDIAGAIAAFRRESQRHPRDAQTARMIGFCHSTRRNWDEAISAWTLYIGLRPQNAQGYFWRGRAYQQLGQPAPAEQDLRTAARLDPEFPGVQAALQEQRKTLAKPAAAT